MHGAPARNVSTRRKGPRLRRDRDVEHFVRDTRRRDRDHIPEFRGKAPVMVILYYPQISLVVYVVPFYPL